MPGVGLDMLANVGSGEVQQRGGAGINSPQGLQVRGVRGAVQWARGYRGGVKVAGVAGAVDV